MADPPFRFRQPQAGAHYYPQQNQQNYHHRQFARNTSPVNSGRGGYSNETPSPSRSPVSQAPTHTYSMYNQNHQPGQHMMMNGGGHQSYMPMNVSHKFQNQNHQQHHGQQSHHHQQNHAGSHGGQMGHQHTFSSGTMSHSTPQFAPSSTHNGTMSSNPQSVSEPVHGDWQHQSGLAAEARQNVHPHRHARKEAAASLKVLPQQETSEESSAENADVRKRFTVNDLSSSQTWSGLDLSGQGLRALSTTLFDVAYTSFLTKLCLDNNSLTTLNGQIGRLRNLTYLNLSNNGLLAVPEEIGMLVNLRELLLFDNKLQDLPLEIGYLCKLETLGLEGNMGLDEEVKGIMVQQGTKALVVYLRERIEAGPPPNPREWHVLDDGSSSAETFSVVSYNILCNNYATDKQYAYTPSRALVWEYRSNLILQELQDYDADFVCLQELDMESYNEMFRRQLVHSDYQSVFWPKTRIKTMVDEKKAREVDGCATFYKKSKYILLQKEHVDFANIAINHPEMKGEHDVFNRVMPKDNIALLCFFENRYTGSRFIVVNAHIHWDPFFADVKLVQVALLMEQIDKFAEKWAGHPPCTDKAAFRHSQVDDELKATTPEPLPTPGPSLEYSSGTQIPLLICGDFNAGAESGVHELITQGSIGPHHSDFKDRSYGSFTRDGMAHNFSIKSAYNGNQELSFTNYTPGFHGVIDYIWYSTNLLQVRGLLGDVDLVHLDKVPGFPNWHFPSDHLALKAEFEVKPPKDRK